MINENNEVNIRFLDFEVDPGVISSVFGIVPSTAWCKGERYVNAIGQIGRRYKSIWMCKIINPAYGDDMMMRRVREACSLIIKNEDALKQVFRDQSFRMDLCLWKECFTSFVEFRADELQLLSCSKVHGLHITFVGVDSRRTERSCVQTRLTVQFNREDACMKFFEILRTFTTKSIVVTKCGCSPRAIVLRATGRHARDCNNILRMIYEALRLFKHSLCSKGDFDCRISSMKLHWEVPHGAVYIPSCLIEQCCQFQCQSLSMRFYTVL